jgi:hypothetical protein
LSPATHHCLQPRRAAVLSSFSPSFLTSTTTPPQRPLPPTLHHAARTDPGTTRPSPPAFVTASANPPPLSPPPPAQTLSQAKLANNRHHEGHFQGNAACACPCRHRPPPADAIVSAQDLKQQKFTLDVEPTDLVRHAIRISIPSPSSASRLPPPHPPPAARHPGSFAPSDSSHPTPRTRSPNLELVSSRELMRCNARFLPSSRESLRRRAGIPRPRSSSTRVGALSAAPAFLSHPADRRAQARF